VFRIDVELSSLVVRVHSEQLGLGQTLFLATHGAIVSPASPLAPSLFEVDQRLVIIGIFHQLGSAEETGSSLIRSRESLCLTSLSCEALVGGLSFSVVDPLAAAEPGGREEVEEADDHVKNGAEVMPGLVVTIEAQGSINTVVNLTVGYLDATH